MVIVNVCISGLVAEYIVAIDVTGVRFPADAYVYLRSLAEGRGGGGRRRGLARMICPGLEPGISGSGGQRLIH